MRMDFQVIFNNQEAITTSRKFHKRNRCHFSPCLSHSVIKTQTKSSNTPINGFLYHMLRKYELPI